MGNQMIVAKQKPLSAAEVKEHVKLITSVMLEVMLPGTHYDTIPGTASPTLLKAGAEKILTTFRIACIPEVQDLGVDGEIRIRVLAKGVHQTSGTIVGTGVGECSSNEEKYQWRGSVCDEEFDATPENSRRIKWSKGYSDNPPYCVRQVKTNPADLANTVLKMAKKRAMVDLCLTSTAASDVFIQDLDDMPAELVAAHQKKTKQAQKPRIASGNASKPASESQCKLLRAKLHTKGKTEDDLCKNFNLKALENMTMGRVNDAIAWIEG